MNRSFVFIPSILLVLFLLNSFFVFKEKESKNKPAKKSQSCTGLRLEDKWLIDPFAKDSIAKVVFNATGVLSIQEPQKNENRPGKKISFYITIQSPNTFLEVPVAEYKNKAVEEVNLETILKNCRPGDVIFLRVSKPGKYDPDIQRIRVETVKPNPSKGNGKC